ncbi:MAG TPA: bifunctional 3,4-dihydroxy-2-butanone-4-phosphate synthase/GTP cyclohydrolase II, partial [Pusillimonas sp.]|nr:bifunctional 3,4-dihydroxy-2-butanone-4-phosphate synthase/GTP cyclohydrolase II [Pusillimonas sp.]
EFLAVAYRDLASGAPHLALARGNISPDTETLVRVHEPTTILDILSADRTAHSWTVPSAMKAIAEAPSGVMVLLNCQGSAELLFEQFDAWEKPLAAPTTEPGSQRFDLRTYGIGAQILRDLNVGHVRLLARPRKMPSMAGFSLTVTGYDSEPSPSA